MNILSSFCANFQKGSLISGFLGSFHELVFIHVPIYPVRPCTKLCSYIHPQAYEAGVLRVGSASGFEMDDCMPKGMRRCERTRDGFRFRVLDFKALKPDPKPLGFFTCLTGLISTLANALFSLFSLRLYEVGDYLECSAGWLCGIFHAKPASMLLKHGYFHLGVHQFFYRGNNEEWYIA